MTTPVLWRNLKRVEKNQSRARQAGVLRVRSELVVKISSPAIGTNTTVYSSRIMIGISKSSRIVPQTASGGKGGTPEENNSCRKIGEHCDSPRRYALRETRSLVACLPAECTNGGASFIVLKDGPGIFRALSMEKVRGEFFIVVF